MTKLNYTFLNETENMWNASLTPQTFSLDSFSLLAVFVANHPPSSTSRCLVPAEQSVCFTDLTLWNIWLNLQRGKTLRSCYCLQAYLIPVSDSYTTLLKRSGFSHIQNNTVWYFCLCRYKTPGRKRPTWSHVSFQHEYRKFNKMTSSA